MRHLASTIEPPVVERQHPLLDAATQANATQIAMLTLDHNCRITQANPAAHGIAVAGETLVGRRFCAVFGTAGIDQARNCCAFAYALKGRERRAQPRWTNLTVGKTTTGVLLNATSIAVPGPERSREAPVTIGAVVTIIGGSFLESADRRYREGIGESLHELRHLVTLQTIAADLLASNVDTGISPAARDLVARARSSNAYLMAYMDDLAYRCLVDPERHTVQPRQVELASALLDVATRTEPLLRLRGQTVRLEVPIGLRAWVDPEALDHILLNLLSNAHKYSVAGDRIVISARPLPRRDMIEIAVRDHGPGVPAADRRRIFERYQRGTQTRGQSGAGLGLAIVRDLVARHGGSIGVRAGRGGGAQFWLQLPAHASIQPDGVAGLSHAGGTP